MPEKIEAHASRSLYSNTIDIYLTQRRGGPGDLAYPAVIAAPVVFVPQTELHHQPVMRLDTDSAQRLMDELWNVGLRPSEGSGSAGSLAATERHLEDMRTLVFDSQYAITKKEKR